MKDIKTNDMDSLLATTTNTTKSMKDYEIAPGDFFVNGKKYKLKVDFPYSEFKYVIDALDEKEIINFTELLSKYYKVINDELWLYFPAGTVFKYVGATSGAGESDDFLVDNIPIAIYNYDILDLPNDATEVDVFEKIN